MLTTRPGLRTRVASFLGSALLAARASNTPPRPAVNPLGAGSLAALAVPLTEPTTPPPARPTPALLVTPEPPEGLSLADLFDEQGEFRYAAVFRPSRITARNLVLRKRVLGAMRAPSREHLYAVCSFARRHYLTRLLKHELDRYHGVAPGRPQLDFSLVGDGYRRSAVGYSRQVQETRSAMLRLIYEPG